MAKQSVKHVIGDRIRLAREQRGLTQGELAERIGMTQTGVASIEAGGVKRPKRLFEIAKALGKTPEFLLGIAADANGHTAQQHEKRIALSGETPVIGYVAAGVWLEADVTDDPPFDPVPVAPNPAYGEGAQFGLMVRGNSIDRVASDGDVVVCLDIGITGLEPRDGDLVVFERRRHQEGLREVTVKRLRRTRAGVELWPESNDPKWQDPMRLLPEKMDEGDDGRIIALVDWIFRPVRKR